MIGRSVLAAVLFLSMAGQPEGRARKLYPVDEGAQDRSFQVFRRELIQAARKRDRKFLLSVLDPQIKSSFGGEGGVKEFEEHWQLHRAESGLWSELITILTLGGSFEGNQGNRVFWAPYVFSQFPKDLDSFEYRCITGTRVNVRLRPASDAPIIGTLSYDIVRAPDPATVVEKTRDGIQKWRRIITPRGKQGYVADQFIRSPIDYRAAFQKVGGRWVMTVLIAGD